MQLGTSFGGSSNAKQFLFCWDKVKTNLYLIIYALEYSVLNLQ